MTNQIRLDYLSLRSCASAVPEHKLLSGNSDDFTLSVACVAGGLVGARSKNS